MRDDEPRVCADPRTGSCGTAPPTPTHPPTAPAPPGGGGGASVRPVGGGSGAVELSGLSVISGGSARRTVFRRIADQPWWWKTLEFLALVAAIVGVPLSVYLAKRYGGAPPSGAPADGASSSDGAPAPEIFGECRDRTQEDRRDCRHGDDKCELSTTGGCLPWEWQQEMEADWNCETRNSVTVCHYYVKCCLHEESTEAPSGVLTGAPSGGATGEAPIGATDSPSRRPTGQPTGRLIGASSDTPTGQPTGGATGPPSIRRSSTAPSSAADGTTSNGDSKNENNLTPPPEHESMEQLNPSATFHSAQEPTDGLNLTTLDPPSGIGSCSAAQLQSSASELVPTTAISHQSDRNVAIYNNIAVVGAPYNDGKRGAAFVYTREQTGEWTWQAKLVAPERRSLELFGRAVAIHGNTIVVGTPNEDFNGLRYSHGSIHVFVRVGQAWTHQAQLVAPDGANYDFFGRSVGVHGDTIVVGVYQDDDNGEESGSAHVFKRKWLSWTHTAKLLAPDGAADDGFGWSVAIHGDTIAIGAKGDDSAGYDSGSVHLFGWDGVTWAHQAKIVAPDARSGDYFGWAVGLDSDTVIVGAGGEDAFTGSAYLFVQKRDEWMYESKLVTPHPSKDVFGLSVGIHSNMAVVGSPKDNDNGVNSGSAHVFVRNGETWMHCAKVVAPDIVGNYFGASVSIHNGTIIAGSFGGEAYLFST